MNDEVQPRAWERLWSFNVETPTKVRNEKGRQVWPTKYKLLPVTRHQCLPDDVPLYAAQHQAKALEGVEAVACLVNADLGAMVWPISDIDEAGTYCDEGEFPELLYPASTVSALQARIAELEKALGDAATSLKTISNLAGVKTYGYPPVDTLMGTFVEVRGYANSRHQVAIDAARKESK
jgi:hypothetical protein